MAQSHFGSFSIDTGATAPNTVDLQTWAFADSVAIYGVGATFLPRITGNGNRLTSNGGFMLGADLDGVHLQFEDGGGSVSGPSLSTLTFSGYSAYSIPQLTINTIGDWIAPATWNAFDFDDTAPAPWLVVNNSGGGIQINVTTPDWATLDGNSSVSATVTLTPSP
jgi:hypothetical protein